MMARPTLALIVAALARPADAQTLTGASAYGDWHTDAPGVTRLITAQDLPAPFTTRSAVNGPVIGNPPAEPHLRVPESFTVTRFAEHLENPRVLRVAPNGDIFVAETAVGRIRVLRATDGADRPETMETFAERLPGVFGLAFYPPGPSPQWLYVATYNNVLRFAYRTGDLHAERSPEVVVGKLSDSTGGHTTRDLVFSADGQRLFVSVGSASNVAEGMPRRSLEEARRFEAERGLGALWGAEANRADVLVFDAAGHAGRIFASGIRNCVGLARHPVTGDIWCSTNERDGMGDDLPPDYVTRVRDGAFYGWPWYYIGAHEDQRHRGERPDLADKVAVPDVLLQPHSAPLGMTFYAPPPDAPAAFPADYQGDAFIALHGSWNRAKRTGYKIVRVRLKDGVPTGEYQDFLIGFVTNDTEVWGRPVGIAVAHDGALLVSEDGNDTIWRIAYRGK